MTIVTVYEAEDYELLAPFEVVVSDRDDKENEKSAKRLLPRDAKYKGYMFRKMPNSDTMCIVALYWLNGGLQTKSAG